ncbi:MAG: hypothetical protein DWQ06_13485 [Calditrichaeota bacterium]|nr:MAG: hypothetical protein DWQ06_13485 [Calditrichota bacterium]
MEIVENFLEWQNSYKEWLKYYELNGKLDWNNYKRPKNKTAPNTKGIKLSDSKIMLISSAGAFLKRDQKAFDASNLFGDYTIRTFPIETPFEELSYAHEHYDHKVVEEDPQSLLPLRNLEKLVKENIIHSLAKSVISFSGYLPDVKRLVEVLIPAILNEVKSQNPDAVLLVPS